MTERTASAEVRVEVSVNAPIERAFRVFTERMGGWWPRAFHLSKSALADVVIEPRVGGRWYETDADGGTCEWGQVITWEPPHRLALSWQIGVGFVPEADPARASRIDVHFVESAPGRTTVTLVHSDFERHGDGWESMRDGVAHDDGWPGILATYAELVSA